MSNIVCITDHVEQAIDRLVHQFKDKPLIAGLIQSFVDQDQILEDLFCVLLNDRWIDTAIGIQLDNFGTIVGQLRNGQNDDDYRLSLKAKIGENNSEGTVQDLIFVFNLLTGSTKSHVVPAYPAEVGIFGNVDISGLDTATIFAIGQRVIPGGVRLYGIGSYEDGMAFSFEGDPNGLGFGDANDSAVGGKFATLIQAAPGP